MKGYSVFYCGSGRRWNHVGWFNGWYDADAMQRRAYSVGQSCIVVNWDTGFIGY